MPDLTCLAEGLIVPADQTITGRNLNEIVVGPTGCGKSFSNAYSRLLHTTEMSVVVPIAKGAIKKKFAKVFKDRGYKVIDLDYAHPEKCQYGYDPLDYVHSDEDVIHLARNLVDTEPERSKRANVDPYWNDSATSILAAEIAFVRMNALAENKRPSFEDVIKFHRSIVVDMAKGSFSSNVDYLFEIAGVKWPDNQASELWKTIRGLSSKTASCIFSIVNGSLDKMFSENVVKMFSKENKVSFSELGNERVALFITTSPMNMTLQNFVNILYSDMLRELFDMAEQNENGRLNVPVHIICDDFACGSRIKGFEDYISIFRAAGISVTLLIQSESQLMSMYGESQATTIINNCDTYVYMGGMDYQTCQSISNRMNKPIHKVMAMPLEQVVVFMRGKEPYEARRYQILSDPLYQELIEAQEIIGEKA